VYNGTRSGQKIIKFGKKSKYKRKAAIGCKRLAAVHTKKGTRGGTPRRSRGTRH